MRLVDVKHISMWNIGPACMYCVKPDVHLREIVKLIIIDAILTVIDQIVAYWCVSRQFPFTKFPIQTRFRLINFLDRGCNSDEKTNHHNDAHKSMF